MPSEDYEIDIKLATEVGGKITEKIGYLAKKYNIYIAIGLLEKENIKLYDTALLFDNKGEIILKYRRINPNWHSKKVSPHLYVEGDNLNWCLTPFGKIAFLICGDMFDERVFKKVKKINPSYLIVPMSRSFGGNCHNKEDWEKSEKWIYTQQVAKIGVTAFIVNAFEQGEDGSFGGSLIVQGGGKILAETEIGKPSILIHKLITTSFF